MVGCPSPHQPFRIMEETLNLETSSVVVEFPPRPLIDWQGTQPRQDGGLFLMEQRLALRD